MSFAFSYLRVGLLVAIIGYVLDRVSKSLILKSPVGEGLPMQITPFMDFVLLWNEGVSYGWFAGIIGQNILIFITLLISVFFLYLLARTKRLFAALAFGAILAGALGNIYDRLIFGAVIDFISLHGFGYHWYIFNLADIWISIGVIFLLWDGVRQKKKI